MKLILFSLLIVLSGCRDSEVSCVGKCGVYRSQVIEDYRAHRAECMCRTEYGWETPEEVTKDEHPKDGL